MDFTKTSTYFFIVAIKKEKWSIYKSWYCQNVMCNHQVVVQWKKLY